MKSKSMSNFEIAKTPLIFELERRSKAQNVGICTQLSFGLRLKTHPDLKMAVILKISNILDRFILTSDIEKWSEIMPEKYF